jgi:amino acid transporter
MNLASSTAKPGLIRALGPLMAIAVVVGTVIGSGVFKKPQVVAANVPYFGLAALAWVLGGVLALLGALALAEVAVLYPRAGGNFVYLREGYGRLWGFLYGWVEFWIVIAASLAALASVFTDSLQDVIASSALRETVGLSLGTSLDGYWTRKWITIAVILGLAVVNVLGVRWGGFLQLLITSVKALSLLGIMALPFVAVYLAPATIAVPPPEPAHFQPVWPGHWAQVAVGGFGTALLGVLWAYHGWMNITPVAEEVQNPRRNIPLALLGGVGIVIALYVGANFAYYLIVPRADMARLTETTVATDFCRRLLGPVGAAVASAAVMCSVFGALNGNLLVGPRVLYAMAEERLAPRSLAAVHPRFHTPAWAILVLAGWASVLVAAAAAVARYQLPVLDLGSYSLDLNLPPDKPLFDVMTDFAMFGAVIFETLALSTIFVFRRRFPNVERPYRCWGYPVVPALYVVILSLVVVNMFLNQRTEAVVGLGFIGLGAIVYGWIRRREKA